MKIILISSPGIISGEHLLLEQLFKEGLEYFHLRKPGITKKETEDYLKNISPSFYKRIIIHDHFELTGKYNLKGIHLSGKVRMEADKNELDELFKSAKRRNLSLSTSVHSVEELRSVDNSFSYVFLSPVFPSISKEGYKGNLDLEEVKHFIAHYKLKKGVPEIIALGGIGENNIEQLIEPGFDGLAMLGYIWKDYKNENENGVENSVERFRRVKEIISKYSGGT